MQRIDWNTATEADRARIIARPVQGRSRQVTARVREILDDVAAHGAAAVDDWAVRLDGAPLRRIEIDDDAVEAASAQVNAKDREALAFAARAIRTFHEADAPRDGAGVATIPGAVSRRIWRPIDTVGLYVPGGTAPLFSTLLMLAIPAAVAGVPRRVAVTPPGADGQAHPMMILAARAAGLDSLCLVGGAQAIAALTFGAGLPRADKIFGPGNAWVAEAKRQATEIGGGPAIDLPAGPSELMVIADADADPELVAADLLGQAEHDADAQVLLATPNADLASRVAAAVERQLADLPRAETARASLTSGVLIVCSDLDQALEIANRYAPEHLSLQVRNPAALLPAIRHAGTVFLGELAAETFGDYVAGPSHVLPTDGAARAFSGVTTAAFMKSFVVQRVEPAAIPALAAAAARLARGEGLEAHARAADLRAGIVRKRSIAR